MAKKKSEPKKAEESVVEEPEKVEAVEKPVEEAPVEEVKPQFKNNTEKGIKIKLIKGKEIEWLTIKPGEAVEVSAKIALANKLDKVE